MRARSLMIAVVTVAFAAVSLSRVNDRALAAATSAKSESVAKAKVLPKKKTPLKQAPKTAAKKPLAKPQVLPRLVDLGADRCIPCKMMAPILDELKSEKKGKLEVVFVDVWKDPDAGRKYGIRVIPTQVFYDSKGKEFFRHEGFYAKKDILARFALNGMKL
jgi:thioredoxin 1